MKKNKGLAVWLSVVLLMFVVYSVFQDFSSGYTNRSVSFSDFLNRVELGDVAAVTLQGPNIEGVLHTGEFFSTYAPFYPNLVDKLQNYNVKIEAMPLDSKLGSIISIFFSWLPIMLLIGVWIFFMKQMQGGGGKAMGFGRSKAKLMEDKNNNTTFDDVAGIDEAKGELTELVEFLRNPEIFRKLGGKIPKGCLLVGPPGTGKTLLAKAIAGEAKVPFFSISGSDFVEMFVGVGASRVRDMFEQGKKHSPCLIFIDEIDAVGRHRGAGFVGGGNDEREQTLNQLLVEMDGFQDNEGIIIIAATNRPDVLDRALLRPGRFDRQVEVPLPDIDGREKILIVHMGKVVLSPDVDARVIARGTPGFSGADLSNIVNEAALCAARRRKKVITMKEFEFAKDKVMMGAERKSMVMRDQEKELTAYHEGGHAIVALSCEASDPVHKATIIPRGRALGMVMRLPEYDKYSVTRIQLKSDLAVAMGGRVAEELIFGYDKVTTGASGDLQQATKMARAMVLEWGMSDAAGPVFYKESNQGSPYANSSSEISEEVRNIIEQEVRKLLDEAYASAKDILTKQKDDLHKLAKALLEYETLSGDEIKDLLAGNFMRKDENGDDVSKVIQSDISNLQ